ncbi:MAG: ABC transporter permease subunit [Clostridiales bacterium]|nr:ABC transporter permease subunit [Clostridiales bacterium]
MNAKSQQKNRPSTLLILLLLIGIICMNLIFPLLALLRKAVDYDPFYQGFVRTLKSASTLRAIWNSVKVTFVAISVAVVFAFFYAYVVELKLGKRRRRTFRFLALLPMLVPSITHGLVIVYLFGKMGLFTRLMGFQLPIYGPLGIVLGSFFYAFPTAFLVLSQAFSNLDGRYFETAVILGTSPFRRFVDIVLPIMKYALFSAFSVCFTMIFTDYGIPLSVGGTYSILPILFYKNVIGLLNFGQGAIYSSLILVPAVVVYLLDVGYFSKKQASSSQNPRPIDSGPFHPLQKGGFVLLTAVVLVPIAIICAAPFVRAWPYDLTLTTAHFSRISRTGVLTRLIRTSVLVSLGTGLAGTLLAFAAGYLYVRDTGGFPWLKKLTHGLYMVSLAIPGLALGLAFALFFKGGALYNTLAILVIANVIHFFGSPYMMSISHFKLLNPNLEVICLTLGGKWYHILFDVIIPNSRQTILDIFVYFFTNSMITISAVSLLYNVKTMTLALQITAYNDQGTWESAVAVSLVILVINTVLKYWQSRRVEKSRARSQVLPQDIGSDVEDLVGAEAGPA